MNDKEPDNNAKSSVGRVVKAKITEQIVLGLFFIQRYRYLSILQFARVAEIAYRYTGHATTKENDR